MAMPIDNRETTLKPVIGVPKPNFNLVKDPHTGRIVRVISPKGTVRKVSPIHQISDARPKKLLTRTGSFTKKGKGTHFLWRSQSTRTRSRPVSTSNLPFVKVTAGNGSPPSLSGSQSMGDSIGQEHRKPVTLPIHHRQSSLEIPSTYTSEPTSTLTTPSGTGKEAFAGEDFRRRIASIAVKQRNSSSLFPLNPVIPLQRASSSTSLNKQQSPVKMFPTEPRSTMEKKHRSLSHLSQRNEGLSRIGVGDSYIDSTPESATTSGTSTPGSRASTDSLLGSGNLSPSYPQVRSPAAAQKLSTFDLSSGRSPISYALENQWGLEPQNLSGQEKIHIQNHCSRLLQASNVTPANDYEMSLLMQTYIAAYQAPFNELFPNICELVDVEPPIKPRDVVDYLRDNESSTSLKNNYSEQIETLFSEIESMLEDGLIDEKTINTMNYSSRIARISDVRQATIRLLESLSSEQGAIYDNLLKDLENLDIQLQAMITALEVLQTNDFRNKRNWDYCIAVMKDIALKYFEEHSAPEKLESHKSELEFWQRAQAYPMEGYSRFIGVLEKIEAELKNLFCIPKHDFEKCRVKVLGNQKARTSSKEFYYFFENQFHLMEVSHQPSGCLTLGEGNGDHDALGLGGLTIPSCDRSAPRAVNMSITRVTAGGTEVMKEVRCGVPYAFTIRDEKRRKEITHKRFLDMLTTCGLAFFEEKMLDHFYAEGEAPKDEFELPIFYNSLLSPDILRKYATYIPFLSLESESLWCHKLSKRIKEFNKQVVTLPIQLNDGTQGFVKVKPNIFFFVNPCNQLSHGNRLPAISRTWNAADPYNEEAFQRLFGEQNPNKPITADSYVQQFLNNNPDLSPELKQELEELHQLLRYIQYNKLHHARSDMPFILSNCISELGRVMNMAVVSGCKSAKDRTGNYERCNIEMAMQLHLSRKRLLASLKGATAEGGTQPDKVLPPWDRWMTANDFYNIAGLLLCSGQMEIAQENLGIPGFKTPSYMLGGAKGVNPTVTAYVES